MSAASVFAAPQLTAELAPQIVVKRCTYSILAAMGPAFCSELVLLRW
jgi:predicted naringenin-chalcone synthase